MKFWDHPYSCRPRINGHYKKQSLANADFDFKSSPQEIALKYRLQFLSTQTFTCTLYIDHLFTLLEGVS